MIISKAHTTAGRERGAQRDMIMLKLRKVNAFIIPLLELVQLDLPNNKC